MWNHEASCISREFRMPWPTTSPGSSSRLSPFPEKGGPHPPSPAPYTQGSPCAPSLAEIALRYERLSAAAP